MRQPIYEGAALIGKVASRGLPLRDLSGWGARLVTETTSDSQELIVTSVEDHGLAHFVPPLLGRPTGTWVNWRIPMPPSGRHEVLVWPDLDGAPQHVGFSDIETRHDDLIWKLPGSGSVAAMAAIYEGARLASYWSTDAITRVLTRRPSARLFALLRWLKVPVLSEAFLPPMHIAVARAPAEFIQAWLLDCILPYGLVHRPAEPGLDMVVRQFLWSYRDNNESQIERIASAVCKHPRQFSSASSGDTFKESLWKLSGLCPSLAWTFAKCKLRGDKYRKYAQTVVAAMLGQPGVGDHRNWSLPYRILQYDVARLAGISPTALETMETAFVGYFEGRGPMDQKHEQHLRRLGEMQRGRQFLSASLLLRLLERISF
jgi:hypothetical protein